MIRSLKMALQAFDAGVQPRNVRNAVSGIHVLSGMYGNARMPGLVSSTRSVCVGHHPHRAPHLLGETCSHGVTQSRPCVANYSTARRVSFSVVLNVRTDLACACVITSKCLVMPMIVATFQQTRYSVEASSFMLALCLCSQRPCKVRH